MKRKSLNKRLKRPGWPKWLSAKRRSTRRRSTRRRSKKSRRWRRVRIVTGLAVLASSAWWLTRSEPPPRDPGDICSIFVEKRHWYRGARRSFQAWGVSEAIQMAILYQESGFQARARPPRRKLWWIIPGRRLSSAYGYAQAIDGTWAQFQSTTGRGRASRHDIGDVTYFVGWYGDQIHRLAGIAKDDAYGLYLAYHEGPAGYSRGSHQAKAWLLDVARRVESRAARYQRQYDACSKWLWWDWRWVLWALAAVGVVIFWRVRRRPTVKRRGIARD